MVTKASEPKLTIYTEEFPPYNFNNESDQLVGINIDIVKRMCEIAKIKCQFQLLPWKRAYNLVLQNKHSGIVSLAKTQQREDKFHWIGPLVSSQTFFYKLKTSKHIVMNDISEAKNYSLGIIRGDIYEVLVKKLGFMNNQNLLTFSDSESFMRLFFKNRIDLFIGSDLTVDHQIKPFGYTRDDIVKLKQIHVDELKGNYIGFNKSVPAQTIERLIKAYNTLKADPAGFEPFIKRYAPK